jgi:hypothetical protein
MGEEMAGGSRATEEKEAVVAGMRIMDAAVVEVEEVAAAM